MNTDIPRGFLQYSIMAKMIVSESSSRPGLTSQEIRKIAKEIKWGEGSFDPVTDRGYYSGPFNGMRADLGTYSLRTHGMGWICKYCDKVENRYILNPEGHKAYENLFDKFNDISLDLLIRIKEFSEKYKPTNKNRCEESIKQKQINSIKQNALKLSGEMINPDDDIRLNDDEVDRLFPELKENPTPKPLRGLNLDDYVVYYRKRNGEVGYAKVISTTFFSRTLSNKDMLQLSVSGGITHIQDIQYNPRDDKFTESDGKEIEIVKLNKKYKNKRYK